MLVQATNYQWDLWNTYMRSKETWSRERSIESYQVHKGLVMVRLRVQYVWDRQFGVLWEFLEENDWEFSSARLSREDTIEKRLAQGLSAIFIYGGVRMKGQIQTQRYGFTANFAPKNIVILHIFYPKNGWQFYFSHRFDSKGTIFEVLHNWT